MRVLAGAILCAMLTLSFAAPAAANEGPTRRPEPAKTDASKAFLTTRLAALDELLEIVRLAWERCDDASRALRDAGRPADADISARAADEFSRWFFKFQDERTSVQQQLDRVPKVVDAAAQKKVAKLEQRLHDLDDVIAYKTGKRDDSRAQADEYRRVAATKSGSEREKYLRKAHDADRQAGEWQRYVDDYTAERDSVSAELEAARAG